MNKEKLIKLRCKAWGITEDEYYCNQCSDFSLEDMSRAYRRGKNKGLEKVKELEYQVRQLTQQLELLRPYRCKAHYVVSDSGRAVECWRAINCNTCRFFKE